MVSRMATTLSLATAVCTKCPRFCNGHYLEPEEHIKWVTENRSDSCQRVPPRVVIEEYVKGKESIGQDDIEHLAKFCFLSLEDTVAWVEHHMSICQRRRQVQQKRQRKIRRNQDDKNCQVDGQEENVYLRKRGRRLHDTVP